MSVAEPESIADSLAGLAAGERTCATLTKRCLDRIAALEPQVQAWAHVDAAGALATAHKIDADRLDAVRSAGRRPAGAEPGDLTGIPLGVKDIIDVAGMPTRAGSPLWRDYIAARDAPIVAALRRAGAIILGKTATCELACFDPAPTRNPWRLDHTPGGSSAGSAAAVACGMCLGAIGTQTGGSIIRPAAYCGVVGVKPTFSPLGREGVVPVSSHLDHLGVFARSTADAFRLLIAADLVDPDEREPRSRPASGTLRLGSLGGMFVEQCGPAMRDAVERALARLAAAGVEITILPPPPDLDVVVRNHRAIMAYEAARVHREAFAAQPDAFGPNIAGLLREGLAIDDAAYRGALAHWRDWGTVLDGYFDEADALLTPAAPASAPRGLGSTGDPRFNVAWSYAGAPAIALPAGLDDAGLPCGLQLIGPRGRWRALAAAAARVEQALEFGQFPPTWAPL